MANKVIFIFQAINKYTKVGKQIARTTRLITKEFKLAAKMSLRFSNNLAINQNVFNRTSNSYVRNSQQIIIVNQQINNSFTQVAKQAKKVEKKIKSLGERLVSFGRKATEIGRELTAKLTLPIIALGTISVMNAAKFQSLRVSFDTMLGSAKKGKKLFDEMRQFAKTTPFKMDEVMQAAKMLLSFNVEAKDMNKTMRMLGDMAAATGKPLREFALVFGQIKAKGKLMAEEANQLAEKGIGIFQELAKATGKSVPQLRKMAEQSKISFSDVHAIMRRMTGQQGKFFQLTFKQSQTMSGAWAILQGQFQESTAEIGNFLIKELKLNEAVRGLADAMANATKGFKDFVRNHPIIAKILLTFVGILAILGPIVIVLGQLVLVVGAISLAVTFFGGALWAALAPILLIIAAVTLVSIAIFMIWKNWRKMLAGLKSLIIDFGKLLLWVFTLPARVIISTVQAIWDAIKWVADKISNLFSSGDMIKGFESKLDIMGTSKTQVDINIKDPGGMVSETKQTTKTPGNQTPLNIGVYNLMSI